MANNFSIFAKNAKNNEVGSGIFVPDIPWETDTRCASGLLPGDFVSSIVLNTVLRQTSAMVTLVAEALNQSALFNDDISSQNVIDNINEKSMWGTIFGSSVHGGYQVKWSGDKDAPTKMSIFGTIVDADDNTIQIGPGVNAAPHSINFALNNTTNNPPKDNSHLMTIYSDTPSSTPTQATLQKMGNVYAQSFNGDTLSTTGTATLGGAKVTSEPNDDTDVVRVAEYKKSALLDMSKFGTKIEPAAGTKVDLNSDTYKIPGNYYCPSNEFAARVSNLPEDWYTYNESNDITKPRARSFTLQVIYATGALSQYPMQIIRDFMTGSQWTRMYNTDSSVQEWSKWSAVTFGQGGIGSSTRPIYLKEGDGSGGAKLTPCEFNIRIESSSTVPTNMNPGDICFLVEG